jgi:hypothetical protein
MGNIKQARSERAEETNRVSQDCRIAWWKEFVNSGSDQSYVPCESEAHFGTDTQGSAKPPPWA